MSNKTHKLYRTLVSPINNLAINSNEALVGGCMSYLWILKPMVSCTEKKAISLSILYYCISCDLCGSHYNQCLNLGGMGEPWQRKLHQDTKFLLIHTCNIVWRRSGHTIDSIGRSLGNSWTCVTAIFYGAMRRILIRPCPRPRSSGYCCRAGSPSSPLAEPNDTSHT